MDRQDRYERAQCRTVRPFTASAPPGLSEPTGRSRLRPSNGVRGPCGGSAKGDEPDAEPLDGSGPSPFLVGFLGYGPAIRTPLLALCIAWNGVVTPS